MKIFISILFSLSTAISLAANYYVNDNSVAGDIYCSAVGNDANAGTAIAPFGSLKHTLTVISAGDFIYLDAGSYSGITTEFGLSINQDNVTIIGAGTNNTLFVSNKNKGQFLKVLANNFNISELTIRAYGYNSGGGGFAQTIEIGNGVTTYSGIIFTNVQLDQNGGSSGESAVLVKSNTSSTFNGGGASCNTETSNYSGAFTITGTNINILFENYVFVFNSGDCFGGSAGGSIRVKAGNSTQNVTVKNSFFSANNACSSTFNGMDMYIETGNVKVYDCLFDNSLSKYASGTAIGGSVAISGSPTVYFTRSKFSNHGHAGPGGMRGCAIGNDGGTVAIDSCLFTGNAASKADDVHCDAGTITARYCTWSEVGQRSPGTFSMSFSGDPVVFEGSVTKVNTTNSTYIPNPSIPSYTGVCGAVIITPACIDPGPPTGIATQTFCSADSPTVADLSATGTGTITWYDQATGGTAYNSTDALVDGAHYYASQTVGGCESSSRLDVTVTIADPSAPTATSSSITECEESPIQTLDANTVLSSTTGITWYDALSGGNLVASPTLNALGTVTYYAEFSDGTCSSLTRTGVTLTITGAPDSPVADVDQSFCKNTNPELSNINVVGESIQYYDSNQNILSSSTLLVDGETYYVTQTVGGCESSLNVPITVYLDSLELNLIYATSTFCNSSKGAASVIADNGYPAYNYVWENGNQSSTITDLSAGDYLVTVTDSLGCQAVLVVSINCKKHPIPGFIAANGSGGNSTWVTNLSPKAEVQIFNRWGNLIFKASPYLDDFTGKSNQEGAIGDDYLPSGTYFYIIDYKNGDEPDSGYLEFIR